MEYYASQDVFDYDVRQRPNTALHQIHAHVGYLFLSHVISVKMYLPLDIPSLKNYNML